MKYIICNTRDRFELWKRENRVDRCDATPITRTEQLRGIRITKIDEIIDLRHHPSKELEGIEDVVALATY